MTVISAFRRLAAAPMVVVTVCGALTLALGVLPAESTSASSASNSVENTADQDPLSLQKVGAMTRGNQSSLPTGADEHTDSEYLPSPMSASEWPGGAPQPVDDSVIPQPQAEGGGTHSGLRVVDVVLLLAVAALAFLTWSNRRILEKSNQQMLKLSQDVSLEVKLLRNIVSEQCQKLEQVKDKVFVDPPSLPDAREGRAPTPSRLRQAQAKVVLPETMSEHTQRAAVPESALGARQTSTDELSDGPGEVQAAGVQPGRSDPPEAPRVPSLTEVYKALQYAAAEALSQGHYFGPSSAAFTEAVLARLPPDVMEWARTKQVRVAAHNSLRDFVEDYRGPDFISVVFADSNCKGWLLPHRDAKYAYAHADHYEGGEAGWPNVKVPAICRIEASGGMQRIKMGTLG